jgi:hypothetical protein
MSQPLAMEHIELNALWAIEAESRLAAYHARQIKAIPLADVLAKYKPRLRPCQPNPFSTSGSKN